MYETIVATCFNILNVAILGGLGWYVYQTRARKQLEQAKAQAEDSQNAVQRAITNSELLFDELHEATLAQKEYCQTLAEHVRKWQAYEAAMIAAWRREQELLVKKIRERHEKQQQGLLLLYAQTHLMPTAIESAAQAVKQQFADPQRGSAYLSATIQHLAASPLKGNRHGV